MSSTDSLAQTDKQYIYVLRLAPRLHDPKAWTKHDEESVAKHFGRLQEAAKQVKVILAGRTAEPFDKTFGLVVFEAANDDAAKRFMEGDPTVASGVMSATLHPYSVALLRK